MPYLFKIDNLKQFLFERNIYPSIAGQYGCLLSLLRQSEGCQKSPLFRHLTAEESESSTLVHPDLPCLTCSHGNHRRSKSTHWECVLLPSNQNPVTPILGGFVITSVEGASASLLERSLPLIILYSCINHVLWCAEMLSKSSMDGRSFCHKHCSTGQCFNRNSGWKTKEQFSAECDPTSLVSDHWICTHTTSFSANQKINE